ncbi:hypothetical protein [Burkholderia cenocepacia]|uniref:Uncharacterized protein n=1 Tax=Burkholderia cenocepacia TaxID=95486 RepID=A0A1V2VT17_9BURK|nr:hypothetical protein [Burkholderia cenocepacia]MBR8285396.1 hypothetical protein [Burkholderia cenocepacia]MBR8499803.1 hypothetical protein [Burkholderia cenocepacia]ONI98643.1 hypothetical protein A8D83_25185 [Burkholderia cenocepacia]ONJ21224.1 hypothetical protein A8D90_20075 [Burkholderia cenocepacia]ONP24082.1 hypothetical protein A8D84_25580 [Burkholderia cenocepacia]
MPWNDERYPPSMRNLPPPVRGKAIEIANALLRQGRTEVSAIRLAIAQAKRWGMCMSSFVAAGDGQVDE